MTKLERDLVAKYRRSLALLKSRVDMAAARAQAMTDDGLVDEIYAAAWPKEPEESPESWFAGPLGAMRGAARDLATLKLARYAARDEGKEEDA